jgi:hypothetical protein
VSLQELGRPFGVSGLNDISDLRLDAKCWMVDTADNIFAYPRIPGQFFLPKTSGHGYTKNQPFFLDVDGVTEVPLGIKKHTHSQDLDLDGGLMINEFLGNIGNLDIYLGNSMGSSEYLTQVSGTGAAVNNTATSSYYELVTGTSSNGYANISRKGVAMDFSKSSAFMARFEYEDTIANYLFREGIAAERVDLANDPTQKSYGIEGCSGQSNFQCWSSDGTSRSATPTSYAVDSVSNVWMAQHNPADLEIIYTKNVNFGVNQVTKTSDIPNSGSGNSANFYSAGIISTTTSQSKRILHRGVVVIANIGTTEWKWYES